MSTQISGTQWLAGLNWCALWMQGELNDRWPSHQVPEGRTCCPHVRLALSPPPCFHGHEGCSGGSPACLFASGAPWALALVDFVSRICIRDPRCDSRLVPGAVKRNGALSDSEQKRIWSDPSLQRPVSHQDHLWSKSGWNLTGGWLGKNAVASFSFATWQELARC